VERTDRPAPKVSRRDDERPAVKHQHPSCAVPAVIRGILPPKVFWGVSLVRIFEEQQVVVNNNILTKVICNKCGREFGLDKSDLWGFAKLGEVHHIEITFGYGSNFDGQRWQFDLCDSCLEELVNSFRIKHETLG